MLGGMNPAKMQAMMKQMGIKQEEIDAIRVIIEKEDGKIVIENPNVVKVNMQGQESWQITGDSKGEGDVDEDEDEEDGDSEGENDSDEKESEDEGFSKEDVDMIVEKTGKSEDDVIESLQKTNDIAETIMELSG